MRVPPMPCIAHRVPERPACKAGSHAQLTAREPVAWRFKERINDEFDSDWILTKYEPADGVRIIAKEPLYTAGVPASPAFDYVWSLVEGYALACRNRINGPEPHVDEARATLQSALMALDRAIAGVKGLDDAKR